MSFVGGKASNVYLMCPKAVAASANTSTQAKCITYWEQKQLAGSCCFYLNGEGGSGHNAQARVKGLTNNTSQPPINMRLVRYTDRAAMLLMRHAALPMSTESLSRRGRLRIGLTSASSVDNELTESAVSCVSRLRFSGSRPWSPKQPSMPSSRSLLQSQMVF